MSLTKCYFIVPTYSTPLQYAFYDNCRNSRALIGSFFCQYAERHEFEIHATRQRARAGNSTVCYRKKHKMMSVFNASVLLLTMNFVITLSK